MNERELLSLPIYLLLHNIADHINRTYMVHVLNVLLFKLELLLETPLDVSFS